MPDKPEHVDRLEMIRAFAGHEDNLGIWGQLYISQTGRTVVGWLVNSWAEGGEPYWQAEMHWFDKGKNKLYHAYFDFNTRSMNLQSEDKDIDPKRAAFIRKMTGKWELEWVKEAVRAGK